MATGDARIGGWWKMYPFMNDAKIIRLDDLDFRLLWVAFEYANAAPWRLGRQGWLYHNEGFPVSAMDFHRAVPKHTLEEVETSLNVLCTVGGTKHTLLQRDDKRKAWRVRAWRKWQDGFVRDFAKKAPKKHRDSYPLDCRPKTLDLSGTDVPAGSTKLESEQTLLKQSLIDHYHKCMVDFCQDNTPEFNGGQAARYFKQQILKERDGARLKETIDEFFRMRLELQIVREQRAAKGGYEPEPVDVTFDAYQSKFQGMWSKVK